MIPYQIFTFGRERVIFQTAVMEMELLGLADTVSELEEDQGLCYDSEDASDEDFGTDLESDSGL